MSPLSRIFLLYPLSSDAHRSVCCKGAARRHSELKALANIIQSSIEQIEEVTTANFSLSRLRINLQPRVGGTTHGSCYSDSRFTHSICRGTAHNPCEARVLTLLDISTQFHVSAAMRTAISTHVAEILRDAGSKGKQVLEIAQPTKVHPGNWAARVLRILHDHIFKEVSPDVFANNRLSSALDTGKSSRSY
ncbi:hypothetical protein BJV77DRAFT_1067278 [Russula vinacea]|nr:hypothetical protein BJV77DRAFT_1067278 [Russula vinacea]